MLYYLKQLILLYFTQVTYFSFYPRFTIIEAEAFQLISIRIL